MKARVLSYLAVALISAALGNIFQPFDHKTTQAQAGCQTFKTGKQVCGKFLAYWQTHGQLAQQGLPLTNEFTEVSA